jgi:hypothetical protein
MAWKKSAVAHFNVLSEHLCGETEEQILNLDSQFPGRDSNPGPSKYEIGVLTTTPDEGNAGCNT